MGANPTTAEPTKRPTVSHDECPSDDIGLAANGQHCSFHGRCEYDFVECCGERGATIACTCEDQRVRCIAIDRCITECPTASPSPEPTRRMTVDPTPYTTVEPTMKPTRPITVDPTSARTDEPSRRPTSATYLTPEPTKKPTEDQSGWGEPKPTDEPTKPIKTPRPTKGKPVKTPRPTKGKPVKTPRPTELKTPRPTKAKPVKTPRPTPQKTEKTPRPTKGKLVKTPRPTAAKPVKTPRPVKTPKPTDRPTKDKSTYITPEPSRTYMTPEPTEKPTEKPTEEDQSGWGMPQPSSDNEEMIAVDMNGMTETTLTGYSAQTEIVGLLSVATVLAIVGYSALCKKNKYDKYIVIEDQV